MERSDAKVSTAVGLVRRLARKLLTLVLGGMAAHAQLVTTGNHRILPGAAGATEQTDAHFSAALAAGDFDRDGYSDLAIGAPDHDVGAAVDAGAVYVVYGRSTGLNVGAGRAPVVLHQDVASVQGVAQTGDRFGAALVAGDFDGDGFDELAVGVPGETIDHGGGVFSPEAGAVHVFPGGLGGLVAAADTYVTGDSFLGTYSIDSFERFGAALAACDRNLDGRDDLQIGVPDHNRISGPDTGVVLLLTSDAGGVSAAGAMYWAPADAEGGDHFGSAIACANVEGTGFLDVIGGAPNAALGSDPADAGAMWVLHTGDTTSLGGGQESARLGSAVATGAFAGPGTERLLLALPGFDLSAQDESGLVWEWVLGAPLPALWGQGFNGLGGSAEPFDHFGEAFAVADFDRDGYEDAVVGVPGENLPPAGGSGERLDAGTVHVIRGGPGGLTAAGSQVWTLDAFFGAAANDRFGAALATGDFDGDGVDDLAIGLPTAAWTLAGSGFVQVVYAKPPGWIFGDGFETGDDRKWGL